MSTSQSSRSFVLVIRDGKGRELGFLNPTSQEGISAATTKWLEHSAKRVLETGRFIPTVGFSRKAKKEYIALSASLDPIAKEAKIEEGTVIPFYFVQRWDRGKKKSADWFVRKLTERKLTILKRKLKSGLTVTQLKKLTGKRMEEVFFPGGEEVTY